MKFSRRNRTAFVAVASIAALALSACDRRPTPTLVRLGDRMPIPGATVDLGLTATLGGEPFTIDLDRDATGIGGITLRLAGTAKAAGLNWRRAGQDRYWTPARRIDFALDASGAEQTYEIDLSREQQWVGHIADLRLNAFGGSLELRGITLHPLASPYRMISLHGVTAPSPLAKPRIEIPFDGDLPRHARFEAQVGLLPEFEREGASGCFGLSLVGRGEERSLYRTCVQGNAAEPAGWVQVAQEVDLPRSGTLVLESTAKIGDQDVGVGAARWGQPLLVAPVRAAERNLVLVVIDTLRADAVGSYGNRNGLTPNLDALAARSVRLANLRAPAPWTLPSMSSLMTGLQPQTHGAGRPMGNDAPSGLAAGFATLAETLAARGFYTSGVYKNIYVDPEFGLHRGFDRYASHDEMTPAGGGPAQESNAGYLVDRAIAELDRIKDRRFFLYLHLFDPHNPYEPPAEWCARILQRELPAAAATLGCRVDRRPEEPIPPAERLPWVRALYDAEVAYTDHELGRFLDALRSAGLDDSTVLAVVSDHGEEFYDRVEQERRLRYDPDSDHGHTLYEELLHVPGIVRVPGLKPGVVEDPVQTVDLFPTLLHAVDVPSPLAGNPRADAQDLLAVLAGEARPKPVPFLADVILHGPPRAAIRRGPWKLVVSPRPKLPLELYDLEADPGETRDVAAAHPDIVEGLRGLLREAQRSRLELRRELLGPAGLRATSVEWSHIAKLRSLGYLH